MKLRNPFSGAQLLRFGVVVTLATGVLATAAGRGTLAYFTTQATSTANTFAAGNLKFTISDNNEAAAATVTSSITLADMKPGDVVYAPVTIRNAGTMTAKWGIKYTTTTTTSNLASALKMAVVAKGGGSATTANCISADFGDANKWKQQIVASPAAVNPAGATIVDSTSSTAPAVAGAYASGEYLPLLAAASDVVCVEITFPDGSTPGSLTTGDNAWNGATNATFNTLIAFSFDAQQLIVTQEFDQ
jgi:predicted ribosomally synthesized peptide with SipW-like signal peptide